MGGGWLPDPPLERPQQGGAYCMREAGNPLIVLAQSSRIKCKTRRVERAGRGTIK